MKMPSLDLRGWACFVPLLCQNLILSTGFRVEFLNETCHGVGISAPIFGRSWIHPNEFIDFHPFHLFHNPSHTPLFLPYCSGQIHIFLLNFADALIIILTCILCSFRSIPLPNGLRGSTDENAYQTGLGHLLLPNS